MKRDARQLDRIFQALGNKHRRAIVYTLALQPASISHLAAQEKLSLPAIHKHIKILEQAGLLIRKKSGRCNFLALDRTSLLVLHDWIAQYRAYWGNNKESLENYVATMTKASESLHTKK